MSFNSPVGALGGNCSENIQCCKMATGVIRPYMFDPESRDPNNPLGECIYRIYRIKKG